MIACALLSAIKFETIFISESKLLSNSETAKKIKQPHANTSVVVLLIHIMISSFILKERMEKKFSMVVSLIFVIIKQLGGCPRIEGVTKKRKIETSFSIIFGQ
jgi:hypothetical protein